MNKKVVPYWAKREHGFYDNVAM